MDPDSNCRTLDRPDFQGEDAKKRDKRAGTQTKTRPEGGGTAPDGLVFPPSPEGPRVTLDREHACGYWALLTTPSFPAPDQVFLRSLETGKLDKVSIWQWSDH